MDRETKLDTIELGRALLGVLLMTIWMWPMATAMYAGDTQSFPTNLTNPVYTITGNSSSLEGMNITFSEGLITISTVPNFAPDNFTLIFFDNLTKEVEKVIYRGGGGSSRTKYVDRNVTVYVPEYINVTKEVEVDKIIYKEVENEPRIAKWRIIAALAVVALILWLIFRRDDYEEEEKYKIQAQEFIDE